MNFLKDLFAKLDGYKTKLAAICTLIVVGLLVFGVIERETFDAVVVALGALGLWALRLAIKQ